MPFYSTAQKRKLLLLLLLRRQWIQSKLKRSDGMSVGPAVEFSGPSSISRSHHQTSAEEDDIEFQLLRLRKEKLLMELEKLSAEREAIAAKKRNIALRKEVLWLKGVIKPEPCPETLADVEFPEDVVRKRDLSDLSDEDADVKIRKLCFDEDSLSLESEFP